MGCGGTKRIKIGEGCRRRSEPCPGCKDCVPRTPLGDRADGRLTTAQAQRFVELAARPELSFPCATVPAELSEWTNSSDGISNLSYESPERREVIICFGGDVPFCGTALIQARDRDGRSLFTIQIQVSPGNAEEASRMVLRAAFLLGLVRPSGGQPR